MSVTKRVTHFVFYGLLFAGSWVLFTHIMNGVTSPFKTKISNAMGLG